MYYVCRVGTGLTPIVKKTVFTSFKKPLKYLSFIYRHQKLRKHDLFNKIYSIFHMGYPVFGIITTYYLVAQ